MLAGKLEFDRDAGGSAVPVLEGDIPIVVLAVDVIVALPRGEITVALVRGEMVGRPPQKHLMMWSKR